MLTSHCMRRTLQHRMCLMYFPSRALQLETLRCGGHRFSATRTLVILEPRVLNSKRCVLLFGMSYWLSLLFHWKERNIVASTVLHEELNPFENKSLVLSNICWNFICAVLENTGEIASDTGFVVTVHVVIPCVSGLWSDVQREEQTVVIKQTFCSQATTIWEKINRLNYWSAGSIPSLFHSTRQGRVPEVMTAESSQ